MPPMMMMLTMMIPPTSLYRRQLLGRSREAVGEDGGDVGRHLDNHGCDRRD
jgi:hypothetical protein